MFMDNLVSVQYLTDIKKNEDNFLIGRCNRESQL